MNSCLKELFVHINESDIIDVADTYNTPVLRCQGLRSKVKVKGQGHTFNRKKRGGGGYF